MKVWTIIKKEYMQIVKKKSFVIATILTPVLMGGLFFIPALLSKVGRELKTIEVVDYSGIVEDALIKNKSDAVKKTESALRISFTSDQKTGSQGDIISEFLLMEIEKKQLQQQMITLNARMKTESPENRKTLIEDLKRKRDQFTEVDKKIMGFRSLLQPEYRKKVLEKKVNGILIIPKELVKVRKIFFFALNISDFSTNKYINSRVGKILSSKILVEKIEDPSIVKIVDDATRDIAFSTYSVKKDKDSESSSGSAYMMSIFMLTILMSIIMAYGQLIMRGVIEEKNNRIVEVLISSTNSQTLFYGKIIGIGLAGLTQVLLWVFIAVIFLGKSSLGIDKSITDFFTPLIGVYFLTFFVIGYFMYAVLFSIVGASVNTDQEAQQFAAPLTYLMFIPLILGIMVTQNPDTPIVVIASLFPLFTPTLMFMRISVTMPSFLQIGISILLSVFTTVFLAWLGAKIFRTGILMYGKKPSIKEIIKWLRYK